MSNLTKNFRSHILILRDWRKFNITSSQYKAIKEWRRDNSRNTSFELFDCDTKELLFDWEVWDIKEFQERKSNKDMATKRFVCWYWTRHPMEMAGSCDCGKKFDCMEFQIQDWLTCAWYKIEYPSDITEQMQEEFLNRNK